ncbi:hypothetical protein AcW1_003052 [Taiwanofungus camphoratus]|nr:hypothetical protein AcW1_003052 [Antrodia cinnamomea]
MLKEVQEATILQQNATIGDIVKALNKKVPDCGWFDAIKGTLRPIFWSICNDEGKLIQATTSTNSTLHMLSQCVEGFTTAAPAYAAATASSATKLMLGHKACGTPLLFVELGCLSPFRKVFAPKGMIDLTSDDDPNWDDIRGVAEITQIIPSISLSDALHLVQGLAPSAQQLY